MMVRLRFTEILWVHSEWNIFSCEYHFSSSVRKTVDINQVELTKVQIQIDLLSISKRWSDNENIWLPLGSASPGVMRAQAEIKRWERRREWNMMAEPILLHALSQSLIYHLETGTCDGLQYKIQISIRVGKYWNKRLLSICNALNAVLHSQHRHNRTRLESFNS